MAGDYNASLLENESKACFSPESLVKSRVQPGVQLSCSTNVGWTSLLVQTYECPLKADTFETLPSPDQLIAIVTAGEYEIESFSGKSWKTAVYRPGCVGMTPPGKIDRLRWHPKNSDRHVTLRIYLPQYFLHAAVDEYRRAGASFRQEELNALSFSDAPVLQTALALAEGVQTGVPNLYAESAAQFLAIHLLSTHRRTMEPSSRIRSPGLVTDRRLRRAVEMMEHHYADNLTLTELAKEAGISRFHFVGLFKKLIGVTPHQYLIRLRMNAACSLLKDTNFSHKEIARQCGYKKVNHFEATFQKYFAKTPTAYRRMLT